MKELVEAHWHVHWGLRDMFHHNRVYLGVAYSRRVHQQRNGIGKDSSKASSASTDASAAHLAGVV